MTEAESQTQSVIFSNDRLATESSKEQEHYIP